MALADFVNEVATHQFSDLLHFRVTQPALVDNALAISILESQPALGRPLTGLEIGYLATLIANINAPTPPPAGTFTMRSYEAAARLMAADWITQAQFLAVLGL